MAIQRALISVSDKTGLEEFAKGLHEFGVELISTGGTAAFLKGLGLPVIEISDYTGEPELFEGRLKTLHPMVHGGLLHRRDNEEHVRQAKENGFEQVELGVFEDNPRAQHLYEKHGFQEQGRMLRAFRLKDGTYRDEIQMVKFL